MLIVATMIGSMFAVQSFAASKSKERLVIEITNADNPMYTPNFNYAGENIKPKYKVTYYDTKNKSTVLSRDQYEISGDTSRKSCGKYTIYVKGKGKYKKLSASRDYTIKVAGYAALNVLSIKGTSVKVRIPGSDKYRIQVTGKNVDYNSGWVDKKVKKDGTTITKTVKGIKKGKSYTVKVEAKAAGDKKYNYSYFTHEDMVAK